jgi:hypothetical protein
MFTAVFFWLLLPLLAQSVTEKSVSTEFYYATGGDDWKERSGWNTDDSICSWHGVFCDFVTINEDSVTHMNLSENNLNGSIPEVFWELPNLVNLDLGTNMLTAANLQGLQTDDDDPSLYPRSPLEFLCLSENRLTGVDGIGHARATLRGVNLNDNQLDGELPMDFFELTNLETLYLGSNQISGTLPTLIGKLSKLTKLDASRNRFAGQIPSEIELLDSCEVLDLGNNFWTGTLPTDINRMVILSDLSIHHDAVSNGYSRPYLGIAGPLLSFAEMPSLTSLCGRLLSCAECPRVLLDCPVARQCCGRIAAVPSTLPSRLCLSIFRSLFFLLFMV